MSELVNNIEQTSLVLLFFTSLLIAVFRDYDKNGVVFRVATLTIFGGSLFITVTSMLFEIWRV
jgi:hypothetical protein